jgi:hypothetical protein
MQVTPPSVAAPETLYLVTSDPVADLLLLALTLVLTNLTFVAATVALVLLLVGPAALVSPILSIVEIGNQKVFSAICQTLEERIALTGLDR